MARELTETSEHGPAGISPEASKQARKGEVAVWRRDAAMEERGSLMKARVENLPRPSHFFFSHSLFL